VGKIYRIKQLQQQMTLKNNTTRNKR